MATTIPRFNFKSYLETHPRLKKVMDVLFVVWFGAVIISAVVGLYGMNTMRAYIPTIYLAGFQYAWIPIIFTVLFTVPVLLLYSSGGFCGMKKKEPQWEDRHFKMVEYSEDLIEKNHAGDELDI